jgi:ribose transport system ATP-binding protein
MAIVFISHRMEEVRALCDRATVFRDGRHVATVRVRDAGPDEIVRLMIGRALREVFPPRPPRPVQETVLLGVQHLGWGTTLRDVSFRLHAGEILGLSGLEGQGQGDLLFALFGVYAGVEGTVRLRGNAIRLGNPPAAMRAGLALVPEDRKTQGLILPLTVRENITLPTLNEVARAGVISPAAERRTTATMLERLSIKTASQDTPVRFLSGGNQQKSAIAKWLLTEGSVYLLYDPTRGIDVGTKQEIYRLMRGLADRGDGLLFFSTDLTEIVGLCDRALVMYEGAIVRELAGPALTEASLVSAALGMTDEGSGERRAASGERDEVAV